MSTDLHCHRCGAYLCCHQCHYADALIEHLPECMDAIASRLAAVEADLALLRDGLSRALAEPTANPESETP